MRPDGAPLTRQNHLVTLTLRVKPSFTSRMRVIAHDLIATSQKEEGCIFYVAAESDETPGMFLIASAWKDRESYEKHRASPYVRAFESQIGPELLRESATYRSWQKLG
jgi:quinol monooxygenase YgiN